MLTNKNNVTLPSPAVLVPGQEVADRHMYCEDCNRRYTELDLREWTEACNLPDGMNAGTPRICSDCAGG